MVPKEQAKAGAKLANNQNENVARYVFEISDDVICSDAGVDAIVAQLKSCYGKKDQLSAWDLFEEW